MSETMPDPRATLKKMNKATPPERLKLRKELLAMMKPKLRTWFDGIEGEIRERVYSNLKFYWRLGKEARAVNENEAEYGELAIEICVGCFQQDKSVIYKAIRFFNGFNEAELEHLLSLRMKETECPVLWSHVVALVAVENKAKRNMYLNKLIQNNWTDEELKRYIIQDMGEKNPAGRPNSGRKLTVPKTIDRMLHHMDMNLVPIAKKFTTIYNNEVDGFLRLVQKTDPAMYNAGMVAEIEKMIVTVESIRENAAIQKKQLEQARTKIRSVLNRQAKAEAGSDVDTLTEPGNGRKKHKAKAAEEPELLPAAVE